MRYFLAVQNIVQLQKQLEAESDPKQRSIIERLLLNQEAALLPGMHKLSAKLPFLLPSPDIGAGPTPSFAPTATSPRGSRETLTSTDFDHRRCPNCESLMRIAYIQPHQLHRDD